MAAVTFDEYTNYRYLGIPLSKYLDAAASDVAKAVASLPHLTSLELSGNTPLQLVTTALTQITTLILRPTGPTISLTSGSMGFGAFELDLQHLVSCLPRQLESLTLTAMNMVWTASKYLPGAHPDIIKTALTSCSGLTSFETGNMADDAVLEVLLTHGKHLQKVTVGSLDLKKHIPSNVECSWDSLTLLDQEPHWPKSWSQLPSALASIITPLPTALSLPVAHTPEDQQAQVLAKAAANLAAGLQKQGARKHAMTLSLFQHVVKQPPLPQYFKALAPLNGYITSLHLSTTTGEGTTLTSEEVTALGQGVGKGLTQITLANCQLDTSFWSALLSSLPALQVLQLGIGVEGAVSAEDISQMGGQGYSRSLELQLSMGQFDEVAVTTIRGKEMQGLTVRLY
jgi:hypothetical protein